MGHRASPVDRTYGRSYHHKTRLGCWTCKARRVKCDETKPSCVACCKARKTCRGYPLKGELAVRRPDRPLWRFRNTFGPALRSSTYTGLIRPKTSLEHWTSPWDPFYQDQVRASGAAATHDFAPSAFWCQRLRCISQHSASAQHCMLALDRWLQTRSSHIGQTRDVAFLHHYGIALRVQARSLEQAGHMSSASLIAALLTCLLLMTLESVQGKRSEFFLHLRHGIFLAKNFDGSDVFRGDVALLKLLIARNGLSHVTSDISTAFEDLASQEQLLLDVKEEEMLTFSAGKGSLDALLSDLQNLLNDIHRWSAGRVRKCSEERKGDHIEARLDLQKRSSKWLDTMRASCLPDTSGKFILLASHELARIELACGTSLSQIAYDGHAPSFAKVLGLLDVALPGRQDLKEDLPRMLAIHMGIQALLFTVAQRCRDTKIRRQAVALLERAPRREGAWHAEETRAAAQAIIGYEERCATDSGSFSNERAAAAIPDTHRVIGASFRRSRSDRALLHVDILVGLPPGQRRRIVVGLQATSAL